MSLSRLTKPVVRVTTRPYRVLTTKATQLVYRLNPDDSISVKELGKRKWFTLPAAVFAIRAVEFEHNAKRGFKQ